MIHIDWICLNVQCRHAFKAEPLTLEESRECPWRWCPICKASSRAIGIRVYEGYFSGYDAVAAG
jgi:hypothetical protein